MLSLSCININNIVFQFIFYSVTCVVWTILIFFHILRYETVSFVGGLKEGPGSEVGINGDRSVLVRSFRGPGSDDGVNGDRTVLVMSST